MKEFLDTLGPLAFFASVFLLVYNTHLTKDRNDRELKERRIDGLRKIFSEFHAAIDEYSHESFKLGCMNIKDNELLQIAKWGNRTESELKTKLKEYTLDQRQDNLSNLAELNRKLRNIEARIAFQFSNTDQNYKAIIEKMRIVFFCLKGLQSGEKSAIDAARKDFRQSVYSLQKLMQEIINDEWEGLRYESWLNKLNPNFLAVCLIIVIIFWTCALG